MAREHGTSQDKLRSSLESVLSPDEELQAVFRARTGPRPRPLRLSFLRKIASPFVQHRIVAVTNSAIHVYEASAWNRTKPTRLLRDQDRQEPLVARCEKRWCSVQLGTEVVWVHTDALPCICAANKLRVGLRSG